MSQLKQFEASVRESLSKLPDTMTGREKGEDGVARDGLLTSVADLVKTHLHTKTTLTKREEELASSRKSLFKLPIEICFP